ncbi:hypothetical protein [Methanoregula sp. UBA64]|jgi:hypothetical protein|uniref:hypothetical protein n=1 Tax=Methanoregula sp. UBA64 TaxID=1915554 RepID=UPI0025CEF3DB|nr:hypothetical protein [Methanoregula sp. UBA64]
MKLPAFILLAILLAACVSLPASAGITAATSGPQTIVKADTVTISGTGAENGTMALWIVGRNYFNLLTATPDKQGNYVFTVKPEETSRFSSGEYALIIQDPGADKALGIAPLLWSDGIRIADQGKVIANIGDKSSFRADVTPVAATILNSSSLSGTDDIFTPRYFYVEEPSVRFTRAGDNAKLPDQATGEAILITGTTNMGAENVLTVEIRNATDRSLVTSRSIPVVKGTNTNQWTYSLDAPGMPAGEYVVTVGQQKYSTIGRSSALLSILEYRLAGTPDVPLLPAIPATGDLYSLILPLIISFAALVIIGIIMIVSLRK